MPIGRKLNLDELAFLYARAPQGPWGTNGSVGGTQLAAWVDGEVEVLIPATAGIAEEVLDLVAAMHEALPALLEMARAGAKFDYEERKPWLTKGKVE